MSLNESFQILYLNEYDDRPLKKIKITLEKINCKKRKIYTNDRPLKKIKLNECVCPLINYSQYKRDILLYT